MSGLSYLNDACANELPSISPPGLLNRPRLHAVWLKMLLRIIAPGLPSSSIAATAGLAAKHLSALVLASSCTRTEKTVHVMPVSRHQCTHSVLQTQNAQAGLEYNASWITESKTLQSNPATPRGSLVIAVYALSGSGVFKSTRHR